MTKEANSYKSHQNLCICDKCIFLFERLTSGKIQTINGFGNYGTHHNKRCHNQGKLVSSYLMSVVIIVTVIGGEIGLHE